ncbi:MAG: trigger factor [Leadbetterella sp.]|nr:MAG: trigger [Chitinophagaceae bacterium]MDP1814642.1 trigger factor [Leadbetterella sp.]
MATIIRENIGLLNDKLTVTITKEDYFKGFDQNLKKYAKTANIPGFRKGMVPSGLVKKMYGQSVFTDEVLRTVETELNLYMNREAIEVFGQPLPLDSDARALDMNNPSDYVFAFEIGLKPSFEVDLKKIQVKKYKIAVTETMIDEEVGRLQTRFGKMTEPAEVSVEDNVLNVTFTETDADGNALENGVTKDNSLLVKYFTENFRKGLMGKKTNDTIHLQINKAFDDKEAETILADLGLTKEDGNRFFNLLITKVGLVEKAEMNEEFFLAAYPNNSEIKTEADFRNEIKLEIEKYYEQSARNQVHDQIYHHLVDHVSMEFPENFLKRWLQTGGEKPKTAEEAAADYPAFVNQLKWTLISSKLSADNKIEVLPEDIRNFAKMQLFSYMGGQLGALGDNQQWIEDYANRMMQDKKFVEDSYHRINAEKLFGVLETAVIAKDEAISVEDFTKILEAHQHH